MPPEEVQGYRGDANVRCQFQWMDLVIQPFFSKIHGLSITRAQSLWLALTLISRNSN